MTRTRLERKPPSPSNWHRGRCVAAGCTKAWSAYGTRLCADHYKDVVIDVLRDLSAAGYDIAVIDRCDVKVAVDQGFYVTAKLPESKTYRSVHRLVMEAQIGRPLTSNENVHHVNGCRFDNSLGNLELWVTAQPSGQRPDDLAAYARKLLANYGTADEQRRYRTGGEAA